MRVLEKGESGQRYDEAVLHFNKAVTMEAYLIKLKNDS
jgi:hypothetical protein